METYFDALPIEVIVKIMYNNETSMPSFLEAYPELTENVLVSFLRTFYPEIYKILSVINKDLDVSFKMLLSETLQLMHSNSDYFEESLHSAEEYHRIWLSESYDISITIVDLTGIILLYKNYKKVYEYMVSNNINKVSGLYDDILKDYPNYPLIFIWVCDMLFLKDYKEMIISDNLDCGVVKDILKITDKEDYPTYDVWYD
jgi:hypothetical protein